VTIRQYGLFFSWDGTSRQVPVRNKQGQLVDLLDLPRLGRPYCLDDVHDMIDEYVPVRP